VNLQTRIVVGMVWVAVLAVATGSVLLLGYALAGVMFALIIALMIRRLVRHHVGHRNRRPSGLSLVFRRESRARDGRRAAA
jgi:membrane protein implicated in regulation of membrane protease activity